MLHNPAPRVVLPRCAFNNRFHNGCCASGLASGAEFICETHLQVAAPEHVARKQRTAARLAWIQSRWDDDAFYEQAVASGRYLKLCETLRWAEDLDDQAWRDLKAAIAATFAVETSNIVAFPAPVAA